MEHEFIKSILKFCDEKEKNGEVIQPKELRERIIAFHMKLEVCSLDKADFILFDLGEQFEWTHGIMSDYYHPIFTSYEDSDNGILSIRNKYGDFPVSLAIEEVKEKYPEAIIRYYKNNH